MTFDTWFTDIGQRTQAFDARAWALAGWLGAKLHAPKGLEGPVVEAELIVFLLEDRKDV